MKRLRYNIAVTAAYAAFMGAGVFAFLSPSTSLAQQGGAVIVFAWGGLCLIGSVLGLAGIALQHAPTEVCGVVAVSTASLLWAFSVILQAIHTDNLALGAAACMGCALAGSVLQRWLDASRSPRR